MECRGIGQVPEQELLVLGDPQRRIDMAAFSAIEIESQGLAVERDRRLMPGAEAIARLAIDVLVVVV